MTWPEVRHRADRLRAVPLNAVLQAWGARRDPHDPHKWHTADGTFSVTGAKFMNWQRGQGGGGAIDLAIHLTHGSFSQALQWLAERFPQATAPPSAPPLPPPAFRCPLSDQTHLDRVVHYLVAQRRLPQTLLAPLIQAGSLYADPRANAVFLLRDPQGQPVGAELRGTTARPWRGMAPGSRKDLGWFAIPPLPPSPLMLCESAIDALSCRILHPQYACLSTAGARTNPRWLPAFLAQGYQVFCGFDADPTGDAMAHAMISLYPSVQRLRPAHKDWNDDLQSRA